MNIKGLSIALLLLAGLMGCSNEQGVRDTKGEGYPVLFTLGGSTRAEQENTQPQMLGALPNEKNIVNLTFIAFSDESKRVVQVVSDGIQYTDPTKRELGGKFNLTYPGKYEIMAVANAEAGLLGDNLLGYSREAVDAIVTKKAPPVYGSNDFVMVSTAPVTVTITKGGGTQSPVNITLRRLAARFDIRDRKSVV